uniref:Uncharacterized protein n=1 Tax=Panagrolaimus sp. PS1159 TaxID=55785 RepID=A0AC35GFS1_9BILA
MPPLESFSIEFCKLSTIPENLLDWSKIKAIGIEGNPFYCNCSMAWLINDMTSPKHIFNFQQISPSSYRGTNDMKCFGPHALRDTSFIHISGKFCLNEKKKHDLTENNSNWSYFLVIVVAFIFGFVSFPIGCYCIRLRKQKDLFFYKKNSDKIMDDFDDGGTSISNV